MELKNTKNIEMLTVKALVYGESGVGKTSTALTLPESETLILNVENKLLPLMGKSYDVYDVKSWEDFREVYAFLFSDSKESTKYKHVFVDSLSEIAGLLKKNIVETQRPVVRGKIDKVYDDQLDIKDWGLYTDMFRKFLWSWKHINKNFIVTCLEENSKDQKTGAMRFGPSIPGQSFKDSLGSFFDLFFRMSVSDFNGESKRFFLTQPTEKSIAKGGFGLDQVVSPDWSKVFETTKNYLKKIKGGK